MKNLKAFAQYEFNLLKNHSPRDIKKQADLKELTSEMEATQKEVF